MTTAQTQLQHQENDLLQDHQLDNVGGGLEAGAKALGELIARLFSSKQQSGASPDSYGMCYDF